MKRMTILAILIAISVAVSAQMMNGGMGMANGASDQKQASSSQTSDNASAAHHDGYTETISFCIGCHQMPHPSQHTAKEWPQVIERMQRHMQQQRKGVPDSSQIKLILEYLDGSKASH